MLTLQIYIFLHILEAVRFQGFLQLFLLLFRTIILASVVYVMCMDWVLYRGRIMFKVLVFILPKVYVGGPLHGRVWHMRSRSAWTVNKHVNKQLPRVIVHLALFILFFRRIVEVWVVTNFFTQPAQLMLLQPTDHAYLSMRSQKMVGTRMSVQSLRAHPLITIFTSSILVLSRYQIFGIWYRYQWKSTVLCTISVPKKNLKTC